MTGFGRAVADIPFGKLIVEIQSVNRKYLEIFVSLPKELGRFENEMRKWVGEALSRGQVSLRLFLLPNAANIEELLPDVKMLKSWKKGWEKIAREVGVDPKGIDLPFLMQHFPVLSQQEKARDEDLPRLRKCVEEALEALVEMKKAEGKALAKDLSARLKQLERMVSAVEKLAPDTTGRMRQKLFEKMEEVLKPAGDVEERLLREVALFAERVDISEEITRFHSHLAQFKELLSGTVVGRKMDFLIQEMGREVNTIGSKSMEAKISHLVVELKSELEKMREQIQNIE
jgi:uncharacterized protein (TIGR00255 family)